MFDFWFEYRHTVPRGFIRLLGKLAELTDSGIPVHFFIGNHDQWMRNYLSDELNIKIYRKSTEFEINGKLFLIGHGHEISHKGFIDRVLNIMFKNPLLRMLFASIHPRWGIAFGKNWSISKRKRKGIIETFEGLEKELIYRHAKKLLAEKHYDFFVFGHRHLALDVPASEDSRYINTGEWIESQTYAVFDGNDVSLCSAKDV
jgi:UDP-2,3-diacylglucosamine hydrolase